MIAAIIQKQVENKVFYTRLEDTRPVENRMKTTYNIFIVYGINRNPLGVKKTGSYVKGL